MAEANQMSATEWLSLADRFLPSDAVADLRAKMAASLRNRRERALAEAQQLAQELAALGDLAERSAQVLDATFLTESGKSMVVMQVKAPAEDVSMKALILHY